MRERERQTETETETETERETERGEKIFNGNKEKYCDVTKETTPESTFLREIKKQRIF